MCMCVCVWLLSNLTYIMKNFTMELEGSRKISWKKDIKCEVCRMNGRGKSVLSRLGDERFQEIEVKFTMAEV